MANFWHECFDRQMPPQQFEQTFCGRCRNPECDLARWASSRWEARIRTQEDRLLRNPQFMDPRDPRFAQVQKRPFRSLLKEALRVQISEERGDWSVPTDDEVAVRAMDLAMRTSPSRFLASESATEHADAEISEISEISDHGNPHPEVSRRDNVSPKDDLSDSEVGTTPVVQPPTPLVTPPPAIHQSRVSPVVTGEARTRFTPPQMNTPTPSAGIMVEGPPTQEPKPKHDPWQPKPPPANIVKPGARIRMGLSKTEDDK